MKITSIYYNAEIVLDFKTLDRMYKRLIEPNETLPVSELSNYAPFLAYNKDSLRIGFFALSTEKKDNEKVVDVYLQKNILYIFLENLETLVAMERVF